MPSLSPLHRPRGRDLWAYVVAWIAGVAGLVGLFSLLDSATRAQIGVAMVPSAAAIGAAAALWLRGGRAERAIERTEQLVEERTNGGLEPRMEAASARGAARVLKRPVPEEYRRPDPTDGDQVDVDQVDRKEGPGDGT